MIESELSAFANYMKSKEETKFYFFVAPNYEDRSRGLVEFVVRLPEDIREKVEVVVIKLQSQNYKVNVLEDIKVHQYKSVISQLRSKQITIHEKEISYPDRYSSISIEHLHKDYIKANGEVVFDFSCFPKLMIIDICKVFLKKGVHQKFSFTYSSPEKYPQIRYPQAIGELRGILENKPLGKLLQDHDEGTLINFPSDLGYSGHLISDQVSRYSDFDQYLFVFMRRRFPFLAYEAMAGNIHLLGEAYREWRNKVINHFTIQDGYRKLEEIVDALCGKLSSNENKHIVIFSPFGPKPLTVGCYLMTKKLKDHGIESEILQESSFQYSSVYSIGLGKTYLFEIEMHE